LGTLAAASTFELPPLKPKYAVDAAAAMLSAEAP
jgi:hypothetical protein